LPGGLRHRLLIVHLMWYSVIKGLIVPGLIVVHYNRGLSEFSRENPCAKLATHRRSHEGAAWSQSAAARRSPSVDSLHMREVSILLICWRESDRLKYLVCGKDCF
jgi:hypothetical protein